MEVGGGGGGPAPFLLKTYDMIEDKSTDDIVCWSSNGFGFVVLDPPEFSRILLPTYFKHNNFSSFIRQLNTYGFRKMDPEKWEFANEDFVRGEKQLMKNIHRRKPIHSHSQPPPSTSGSDLERETLEEEIHRLTREKNALQTDILKIQQCPTESQLHDLETRIKNMEQRQQNMANFLVKASKNPAFVDNIVRLMDVGSNDFSVLRKKRRRALLKEGDADADAAVCSFSCDDDLSEGFKGSEFGTNMFQQDFNSKLKLELSPAILNSHSSDDCAEVAALGGEDLSMDTGASFLPRKNSAALLPWHSSRRTSSDDLDGDIPCHLNLTLASSSPLQFNNKTALSSERALSSATQDLDDGGDIYQVNEEDLKKNTAKKAPSLEEGEAATASSPPVVSMPVAGKNDLFWEQFLTERPGSSDTEEASSILRSNSHEDRGGGEKEVKLLTS